MKLKLLPAKSLALLSFFSVLLSYCVIAQPSTTVAGKINDENGKGIPGVTIQVKGSNNRVTSLSDGSFTIANVKGSDILVFTSVGYQEQEVPVNNRSIINLSLDISQKTLSDVVVIGYG